jgi:hypothetical protein
MGKTRLIKPRKRLDNVVSFPLEHQIPVQYTIVGRPAWQRLAIPAEAARPDKRLLVHSPADLDPFFDFCHAERLLSCDSETSGPSQEDGLDPVSPTSQIVLFQLGTEEHVYLLEPDLLGWDPRFKTLLEGTHNLFLLQNAVHDFKFLLTKYGIHLVRIYCAMLAEQVLTAGKEGVKVGLAELTRKYPPYRYIRKTARDEFVRHSGTFTRSQLYYGGLLRRDAAHRRARPGAPRPAVPEGSLAGLPAFGAAQLRHRGPGDRTAA